MIELKNIVKNYENGDVITHVLKDINLTVEEGEFIAIIGPSGSGKSTLMHTIGFLDRPTSGEYIFEGENTKDLDDDQLAVIRNKHIGFVFQSFNLLPRTSVLDNVILPLLYSDSKIGHEKKAKEALAAVNLTERMNYMSNQISGGQKQRVAIARALVCNPKVIFADEPTGNLDSKSGSTVMHILENLNKEGRTIILVTHDLNVANHSKRIVTIRDGEIVSDRKVEEKDRVHSKQIED
ncbi:MAG: ABC transporter ATP-binding protein [Candidatus Nomurabacteria bacterium]|nr:ABC transporter ATP-binding protein [Candidatus Nomurabacteria bacterium]